MGKDGSELHSRLVESVRRDVTAKLIERGREFLSISAEPLMQTFLGMQQRAGSLIPDALFIHEDESYIVEVGQMQVDKWWDKTVIHLGFTGKITVLNPTGSDFEKELIDVISKQARLTLSIIELESLGEFEELLSDEEIEKLKEGVTLTLIEKVKHGAVPTGKD
jgi:hypothetical protein